MTKMQATLLALLLATATGCPSGDGDAPAPPGRFGDGHAPESRALDAYEDSEAPFVVDDSEKERVSDRSLEQHLLLEGGVVARTVLEVAIAPDATVADVNLLLDAIPADVVGMLKDTAIVTIRFVDPGSLAGLGAIIDQIKDQKLPNGEPLARYVVPAYLTESLYDYQQIPTAIGETERYNHQLAVGAASLWNLRDGLLSLPIADRPDYYVIDGFGRGAPKGTIAAYDEDDFFTSLGDRDAHGYRVLGVALGDHDGSVSGLVPSITSVPVHAIDGANGLNLISFVLESRLIRDLRRIAFQQGKVALNTSFGLHCDGNPSLCRDGPIAKQLLDMLAFHWIEKVRTTLEMLEVGAGVENAFVQTVAAGNDPLPNRFALKNANIFARAGGDENIPGGLLGALIGVDVPPLSNVIAVGNSRSAGGGVISISGQDVLTSPYEPGCLNEASRRGAPVSAIGTDVAVLDSEGLSTGTASGSSFAAPQVWALANLMWWINPDLTPAQVKEKIITTAKAPQTDCPDPDGNVPVIDVFAALLSLDDQAEGRFVTRTMLLDIDADVAFDHNDIADIVDNGLAGKNGGLDYGRYDFNGDGRTGGETDAVAFDLDADGVLNGALSKEIEGQTHTFNEAALTDHEILCYYAYDDDVYSGKLDERAELFGEGLCRVYEIVQTPTTACPLAMASPPGTTYPLDFQIFSRASHEGALSRVPVEAGHLVELVITSGGGATPLRAQTNDVGFVSFSLQMDDAASNMTGEIRLVREDGGAYFDQKIAPVPRDPSCASNLCSDPDPIGGDTLDITINTSVLESSFNDLTNETTTVRRVYLETGALVYDGTVGPTGVWNWSYVGSSVFEQYVNGLLVNRQEMETVPFAVAPPFLNNFQRPPASACHPQTGLLHYIPATNGYQIQWGYRTEDLSGTGYLDTTWSATVDVVPRNGCFRTSVFGLREDLRCCLDSFRELYLLSDQPCQ
jgi:hypothetical protein